MNTVDVSGLEDVSKNQGTVLQYHLRNKTIRPNVIQNALQLDRTTIRKWSVGALFPQRPNAVRLIEVFGEHGIKLDYNDIYRIEKAS